MENNYQEQNIMLNIQRKLLKYAIKGKNKTTWEEYNVFKGKCKEKVPLLLTNTI